MEVPETGAGGFRDSESLLASLSSGFAASNTSAIGALLLGLAALYVCFFAFDRSKKNDDGSPKLPPGPRPWPIVGNLLQLGRLPHRSLEPFHKKYGPLIYLRLGNVPTVVINDSAVCREFYKVHEQMFSSRPQLISIDVMVYGGQDFAMAAYGHHWRYLRKICVTELLTPKRHHSFYGQREEEANIMVKEVMQNAGRLVHVRNVVKSFNMSLVTRMLIGKRASSFTSGLNASANFVENLYIGFHLLGVFVIADYLPWLRRLDIQGYEKRMRVIKDEIDVVLNNILEEHRQAKPVEEGNGEQEPKDFVDTLLTLPGEYGEPNLPDNVIKAIILDMIAGSTESTTVLAEWVMSELVRRPEIQKKLHAEMDKVVGKDRILRESDLQHLHYLQAIVQENFRLHPVGSFNVPREAMQDCVIMGYRIPKGTRILFNSFSMGRSANTWENPLEFIPERWLGSSREADGGDDSKFVTKSIDLRDPLLRIVPFGYGRRSCPGNIMGQTMSLLALGRLLHSFSWSLPPGTNPEDVNMDELFGITSPRAVPIMAVPTPRLPLHLY